MVTLCHQRNTALSCRLLKGESMPSELNTLFGMYPKSRRAEISTILKGRWHYRSKSTTISVKKFYIPEKIRVRLFTGIACHRSIYNFTSLCLYKNVIIKRTNT